MNIQTVEQAKNFFILSQKSADELRAICEGLQLDTTGEQEVLLERLMSLGAISQTDFNKPQMIPLRTRNERGEKMEDAFRAIYHWRGQIFKGQDNYKVFTMLNSHGALYSMKMKYILCPANVLQTIISKQWYDPQYIGNGELIQQLKERPQDFVTSIVQRQSAKGNTYIMLHAERKAA